VRKQDQRADNRYAALQKAANKASRTRFVNDFKKLDKKLQATFPKFFYKQKVLEEFVEKNGQRRARAPFRKGMACIVYDLELQILALADQVELRTELVPALGQSHVERAEHEQGLDVAVEHFAHVTGRGGVSGGAEPPAIDGTNNRRSHQPGSFRHVTESMGQPAATPRLRTRQHA